MPITAADIAIEVAGLIVANYISLLLWGVL